MGAIYPIMLLCLIVIAGIHFRKGWVLLNIVAFTSIITVWLKEVIDYPRPLAVDSELVAFGEDQTQNDLTPLQPRSTFELFNTQLLNIIRSNDIGREGLPSGHTSVQFALWIGMAFLFRKKWLWVVSISFVLLTMWSRMYLAMHYPGDIIGGLMVGVMTVSLVYWASHLLDNKLPHKILFSLMPVLTLLFLSNADNWQSGLLLGANLGILILLKQENPTLRDTIFARIGSTLTLIVVFMGCFIGIKYLSRQLDVIWKEEMMMLAGFVSVSVYLLIAKKTGWLS